MDNDDKERYTSSMDKYPLMGFEEENSNRKDPERTKKIIIAGILSVSVILFVCGLYFLHPSPVDGIKDFPPVIIHFDSREKLREFEPIQITDQFVTNSGDEWHVSHYFLLFSEDLLYKGDIEGVTVLTREHTEEAVVVYWQYGWFVIKRYEKEEIRGGLHVYLECSTHTFLPEPLLERKNAAKTADSVPLSLEETTLLSVLNPLGELPYGLTDGKIVIDDIDWEDVSYSLKKGLRKMENWLEKEGVSGAPRTLRLEPLKSFSTPANYHYLVDPSADIVDIRSTLYQGKKEHFVPGQLTCVSEKRDTTEEGNWFIFQYLLKTRAAEPGEKTVDLGSSEAVSLVYFLTGLTLPNDTLWVNLDPWEPERIVISSTGSTMIGRIMLEADLQMKRDFCNYEDPCKNDTGVEYWNLLNKKREELVTECMKKYPQEILDVDNIFFSAATRHWIVPDKITIYEDEDKIYIVEATLNIYSEPVYEHSTIEIVNQPGSISSDCQKCLNEAAKEYGQYAMELEENLILPLVVKEVNTGDQYTDLRQVYTSLVLAQWYKSHCDQCLFSTFNNTEDVEELEPWKGRDSKEIWEEYVESYKEGECYCEKTQQEGTYIVTQIYRGGGINFTELHSYPQVLDFPSASQEVLLAKTSNNLLVEDLNYFLGNNIKVLEDENSTIYSWNLMMLSFTAPRGGQNRIDEYRILICEITVIAAMWLTYGTFKKKVTKNHAKKHKLETKIHGRK